MAHAGSPGPGPRDSGDQRALAYVTNVAAGRHRDARVVLISLAFLASAGFLGLHALATPGVLLANANAGFAIATPIGLVIASVFAVLATGPFAGPRAQVVLRLRPVLLAGLLAVMAVWAVLSIGRLPPLDGPPPSSEGVGLLSVTRRGRRRSVRRGGVAGRSALSTARRQRPAQPDRGDDPAGGGHGGRRPEPQLALELVGVAPADARGVRGHRSGCPKRVPAERDPRRSVRRAVSRSNACQARSLARWRDRCRSGRRGSGPLDRPDPRRSPPRRRHRGRRRPTPGSCSRGAPVGRGLSAVPAERGRRRNPRPGRRQRARSTRRSAW